jgi:hypothetical protein
MIKAAIEFVSTQRGWGLGGFCPLIVAGVLGFAPADILGLSTLIQAVFPRLRPTQTRWLADRELLHCLR